MDRFVVRTPKTGQKKATRQAGYKLKTIQLNLGNKGIAQSWYPHCAELRNYLSKAQPDIVLLEETVTHVYNECEDLQLIGLRHDISTATGRVLNAACLVTDPASALEYHDRAIGFLQRRGGIVA